MNEDEDAVNAYTIRLELVDEPGELLRSLRPISQNGGNLLSIFHERGNVTPRGHIPVEVDLEATESQYEAIVEDLQAEGINVIQAGAERYSESLVCVLSGHIVDTDLSDTLSRIQEGSNATVTDLALSAPEGTRNTSSARLRLAVEEGEVTETLERVREIAAEKDLHLIESLTRGQA
ncbi:amino acid-binding protein [Halorubrum sp. CBA1125]|uniref:amino acid-binding protein n=1 Tax=Halorubrum sp. CBA1125 TaxID=2668072 RepID=UPI0012E726B0|nr:amino acid-binding protein [Halorubrum sp. CBA1125]MUW14566.1 amino acid-binding protein [Halorubrum sp. CBA1125]